MTANAGIAVFAVHHCTILHHGGFSMSPKKASATILPDRRDVVFGEKIVQGFGHQIL
jgi:hypothetical protein